jgi:hypothetical protein
VPKEGLIGAGRFQAAKIGKSKKKEGRIYIIYRFSLPIIDSLYER